MNNQRFKLLLLISLLAAVGAVVSAFAAGSHFQLGFSDGAFSFDFRIATGDSRAASVLGLIALATGLVGVGLYILQGDRDGGAAAPGSEAGGSSGRPNMARFLHRLAKSRKDAWLGGVCGGLGEHTPLPSWVWRLVFLVLLCWYGAGVVLYAFLWICLPEPSKEGEGPGPASATTAGATE